MMNKIIVFILTRSIKGIMPRNTDPNVMGVPIKDIMITGREIIKVMIGGISPKNLLAFFARKTSRTISPDVIKIPNIIIIVSGIKDMPVDDVVILFTSVEFFVFLNQNFCCFKIEPIVYRQPFYE